MAELPTSGPGFGLTTINNAGATNALHNSDSHKQEPVVTVGNGATSTSNGGEYEHPEQPTEDVQRGVPNVEAVTITWSKRSLIALFILWVQLQASHLPSQPNLPFSTADDLITECSYFRNTLSAHCHLHCCQLHISYFGCYMDENVREGVGEKFASGESVRVGWYL